MQLTAQEGDGTRISLPKTPSCQLSVSNMPISFVFRAISCHCPILLLIVIPSNFKSPSILTTSCKTWIVCNTIWFFIKLCSFEKFFIFDHDLSLATIEVQRSRPQAFRGNKYTRLPCPRFDSVHTDT